MRKVLDFSEKEYNDKLSKIIQYKINMGISPSLFQAYKPATPEKPRIGIKSTQEDLLELIKCMESKQMIETTAEKESAKTTIDNKKTFRGKLVRLLKTSEN